MEYLTIGDILVMFILPLIAPGYAIYWYVSSRKVDENIKDAAPLPASNTSFTGGGQ